MVGAAVVLIGVLSPVVTQGRETGSVTTVASSTRQSGLGASEVLSAPSKFHPVAPARIPDTRSGLGGSRGPIGATGTVVLSVAGVGGVPPSGASAVVLNVTMTDASGVGFVQVFPTGGAQVGASSNLHVEHVGQTIPNLVVVPIGGGGQVSIFTQSGGQLLADVFGWFGPSAPAPDGLYVPLAVPVRYLDSRDRNSVPVKNPGDVVNCDSFPTWDAANRWFWTYLFYGDVGRLDSDGNTIPCESKPDAPTAPVVPPDLFKLTAGGSFALQVAGIGAVPNGRWRSWSMSRRPRRRAPGSCRSCRPGLPSTRRRF
jgi:hypothetical protein